MMLHRPPPRRLCLATSCNAPGSASPARSRPVLGRSARYFVPFLLAIAIRAIGVAALTGMGVIAPEPATFAPLAVIGGGLLFGVGIIMAGGCATGTYYRAGEGLIQAPGGADLLRPVRRGDEVRSARRLRRGRTRPRRR